MPKKSRDQHERDDAFETRVDSLVEQTYDQFSKQVDLENLFGKKAAQQILNNKNKPEFIRKKMLDFTERLDSTFEAMLPQVRQQFALNHTPRGDVQPDLANKNKVSQNLSQQQLKQTPWLQNLDLPGMINRIIQDNPNNPKAITTQLDRLQDKLKNQLKLAYRQRLAAKLTPSAPAPKPKRPGDR